MLEAKAKDTSASALKKKVFTKILFFKRFPQKNVFQKIFQALHKILTIQKIVLSSSWGQANFRGLEASRPRPRTWPSRPRPRTSKCDLKAKDVLEDSTSAYYYSCSFLFLWTCLHHFDKREITMNLQSAWYDNRRGKLQRNSLPTA